MSKLSVKMLTLGFAVATLASPAFAAGGGGGGSDQPATSSDFNSSTTAPKKKGKMKKSEMDFIQGYRNAYATIYDKHDYATAIEQLRALNHDTQADVANLLGYSYRMIGQYGEFKKWYETALQTDPNHVRTWQYYGLWQIEQGHPEQAEADLSKIGSICGTMCPEYRSLAAALNYRSVDGGHVIY